MLETDVGADILYCRKCGRHQSSSIRSTSLLGIWDGFVGDVLEESADKSFLVFLALNSVTMRNVERTRVSSSDTLLLTGTGQVCLYY
jgi:hypothetical protein